MCDLSDVEEMARDVGFGNEEESSEVRQSPLDRGEECPPRRHLRRRRLLH